MTIRTIILTGLMAATALSATAPAYAQNVEGWRQRANNGEMRQQRQEQRQQRQEQPVQQARPAMPQQQAPQQRADAGDQGPGRQWRGGGDMRQPQIGQQQTAPQFRRDIREDRRDVREDRRDVRNDGRYTGNRGGNDNRNGDWRNDNWRNSNSGNGNWAYNNRGRIDNRERWSNQQRWDNGWRNDRRYDWQNYRRSYGDVYRPGRYYAPRGWNYGYRQFSVGIYLNSLLYSNNYWLDDPYQYRLPPAYGSLRWIRYYDDALLVDTRDGYVVDVINGFFY